MHIKRDFVLLVVVMCAVSLCAQGQWLNYPSAGIPRTADGKPNLSAPTPRTPDGKPDLSGVWMADGQTYFFDLAAGLKPEDVRLQPWASDLQKQREDTLHADDPLAKCLPHGVPRINTNGLFPFKIIQTPGLVVILYEQMYLFRQVFMDGRKLEADPNPSWQGYSIGRWEGDTLVIDSAGFRDDLWLDWAGSMVTGAGRIRERITRTHFGQLEIEIAVDDPKAYTRPWSVTFRQQFAADTELIDEICGENETFSQKIK